MDVLLTTIFVGNRKKVINSLLIFCFADDALNKLLNDNSRLLFNSFSQIAEKMVQDVFAEALKPMLLNYSYDELLPETL